MISAVKSHIEDSFNISIESFYKETVYFINMEYDSESSIRGAQIILREFSDIATRLYEDIPLGHYKYCIDVNTSFAEAVLSFCNLFHSNTNISTISGNIITQLYENKDYVSMAIGWLKTFIQEFIKYIKTENRKKGMGIISMSVENKALLLSKSADLDFSTICSSKYLTATIFFEDKIKKDADRICSMIEETSTILLRADSANFAHAENSEEKAMCVNALYEKYKYMISQSNFVLVIVENINDYNFEIVPNIVYAEQIGKKVFILTPDTIIKAMANYISFLRSEIKLFKKLGIITVSERAKEIVYMSDNLSLLKAFAIAQIDLLDKMDKPNNKSESSLSITETEKLKSICTHRFADGTDAIDYLDDGGCKCRICGHEFKDKDLLENSKDK